MNFLHSLHKNAWRRCKVTLKLIYSLNPTIMIVIIWWLKQDESQSFGKSCQDKDVSIILLLLYTYTGRPPLEDLHRGNCAALHLSGLNSNHHQTSLILASFVVIIVRQLWQFPEVCRVSEPVRVLRIFCSVFMMFMLKHKDWITTAVNFSVTLVMIV